MKLQVYGRLPVSPSVAWRVLVQWERQRRWMLDADEVMVIGGRRQGVGTRVAVATRVAGVPAFTEVLEVTRWRPPEELEVRHSGLVRGSGRWRLRPAIGGSIFRWDEDISLPGGPIGEAALLAYRPVMWVLMRLAIRRLATETRREARRLSAPGYRPREET